MSDINFRCVECGAQCLVSPGAAPERCICPSCNAPLRYTPCFGCGGPCQVGQVHCANCKARAKFGPLPPTAVERHVREVEVQELAKDLHRIERELREAP